MDGALSGHGTWQLSQQGDRAEQAHDSGEMADRRGGLQGLNVESRAVIEHQTLNCRRAALAAWPAVDDTTQYSPGVK